MLKLARWLRTVRQNCSMSLPYNNFPFLQLNDESRKLHLRRMWFRPISELDQKADTSGVRRNGQNGIHMKPCPLASENHRIGPKMVSEAIS